METKNYSGMFYGPSTLRVGLGEIKKCYDCEVSKRNRNEKNC